MRVLIACEFSGVVREAFRRRGHDAMSCDLLPSEQPGSHYQGPVEDILDDGWDMMVAHPPCTYLAVSGARWFRDRLGQQEAAIAFVRMLEGMKHIQRIAIENPISILSTRWRKPDQIVQPWWFGHGETKAICLWLKNLPQLWPIDVVEGRRPRVHFVSLGPDRWKERSRTMPGLADAMADQWGGLLEA